MKILLRNNTGNQEREALVDGFVVRTKYFNSIFKEIAATKGDKPEQHYLIIGQRGAGKTTLLYRLKYEIEDKLSASVGIIPVMFSEEQYNVSEVENIWEYIGELLEEAGHFNGLRLEMEGQYELEAKIYEEKILDILHNKLKESGKKLVVFIENIDMLFRKIGVSGQQRLREVLMSSPYIRLITTSTGYFEDVTDYTKPFYDFFKIIELSGLSNSETVLLLQKIAEHHGQLEKMDYLLRKNPQRIESLRRLTGGIPRIISYLFQIFLDNENGKAIRDLYQLIDDLTLLYKSEIDRLSAQQQKVVHVIAKNWDAIGVKEVAAQTKIESKQVSSILSILEKNRIIELVPTKTKNNLYRIRERFMNIWYLMRFGKKHERENVIWLVRFYDAWCDKIELAGHVSAHIKNLSSGKYDPQAALDMGNAFLDCEGVSDDQKYQLLKATRSVMPKEHITELRGEYKILFNRINQFVKINKYDEAAEVLNEVDKSDPKYYSLASFFYSRVKEFEKSVEAAETFYKLNPQDRKAAFRVGLLSDGFLKNFEKALEYYQIALTLGESRAALLIGNIYSRWHMDDKAIEFYEKALQDKDSNALVGLGDVYGRQGEFNRAKTLYKRALREKISAALIGLGRIEMSRSKPNIKKAHEYFQEAYDKKVDFAGFYLGRLCLEELNEKHRGIELLNNEIEKGSAAAAHLLAHHYDEEQNWVESDRLFMKSYELGRVSALSCLIHSIFRNNRKDKNRAAIELLEKHLTDLEALGGLNELDYAFMLLWDGQIDKSLDFVRSKFGKFSEMTKSGDEDEIEFALHNITDYLLLLIAKGQLKAATAFFEESELVDLRQVLRPVYYALMNFMKEEFPKEYLKAGSEMKQTVEEILKKIEAYKENL